MASSSEIDRACRLLEEDTLRNVVTLKMLNSYGPSMDLTFFEAADRWALLSLLPTRVSEWDRKAYPDTRVIAFADGNADSLKLQALAHLPKGRIVVKTGDPLLKETLERLPDVTRTTSYRSFTSGGVRSRDPGQVTLASESTRSEAAGELFQRNGYEPDELDRYFRNGARWFGAREAGELASVCFVYQNYKAVWEIAGVYTVQDYRKRGLGKAVVEAAVRYLEGEGRTPRYQARWDNEASLALARSSGLVEFLRVDHFLVTLSPIP